MCKTEGSSHLHFAKILILKWSSKSYKKMQNLRIADPSLLRNLGEEV